MILLLLLVVSYVSAGNEGIVKNGLPDDAPYPDEGKEEYTHLLECDYRHNFPGDKSWTYTYDLHCMSVQREGKDVLQLSVNYDNNVFDIFEVTSCEKDKVVKSLFPPKQKDKYVDEDKPDKVGRPTISYLKWITPEGKCFARSYEYVNRNARAAQRSKAMEIDCDKDMNKYQEVAEFTNCRAPKIPLTQVVTGWSSGEPEWTPNTAEGKKHEKLLECTFDQFSKLYHLTCVKKDNEYYAFVTYMTFFVDRLTVTSCEEEDIVNGIFPAKDTTANPKVNGRITQKIWFGKNDGKCYQRQYPKFYNGKYPSEEPTNEKCPEKPDEWTNPTSGHAGMWRECWKPKDAPGKSEEAEPSDKKSTEAEPSDKKSAEETSGDDGADDKKKDGDGK